VTGRTRRTPRASAPPHPIVDHTRPLGLRTSPMPASATDSRTSILTRVAAATATQTAPTIDRSYRAPRESDVVKLFIERVSDYRASVRTCDEASLPNAVTEALGSHASGRIGIPSDLPGQVTSKVPGDLVVDDQLSADQLDGLDAVITTCRSAVAESGTVILDHGPGQGRRALTLVPDHHVLIVAADQIHDRLPDALAVLDPTTTQTWISGPSATSDIELDRVEGVHGPRTLDIIVII
jgi:L-lactate dehydrogenase complex protein LldG